MWNGPPPCGDMSVTRRQTCERYFNCMTLSSLDFSRCAYYLQDNDALLIFVQVLSAAFQNLGSNATMQVAPADPAMQSLSVCSHREQKEKQHFNEIKTSASLPPRCYEGRTSKFLRPSKTCHPSLQAHSRIPWFRYLLNYTSPYVLHASGFHNVQHK